MRVTVALPTLRPGAHLPPLLTALRAQRGDLDVEILVADSGSPPADLAPLGFAGARLLRIPPGDFNHGATRNRLAEAARGEIVAFLTQDALPLGPFYLSALVSALREHPGADGAYARQRPRPDADPSVARRLAEAFPPGTAPVVQAAPPEGLDALSPAEAYRLCRFDHVASAARRTALLARPLATVPFGEDLLWARDTLRAGNQILYVPGAEVLHSHRRGPVPTFQRTALEHALLCRRFGLRTVPDLPSLGLGALSLLRGRPWAWAPGERGRLLAELLGQYMGPRLTLPGGGT